MYSCWFFVPPFLGREKTGCLYSTAVCITSQALPWYPPPYMDAFLLGSAPQARPCRHLPCLALSNGFRLNCLLRGREGQVTFFNMFFFWISRGYIIVNPQGDELVWNVQQICLILSPALHGLGSHLKKSWRSEFQKNYSFALTPSSWSLITGASILFYWLRKSDCLWHSDLPKINHADLQYWVFLQERDFIGSA